MRKQSFHGELYYFFPFEKVLNFFTFNTFLNYRKVSKQYTGCSYILQPASVNNILHNYHQMFRIKKLTLVHQQLSMKLQTFFWILLVFPLISFFYFRTQSRISNCIQLSCLLSWGQLLSLTWFFMIVTLQKNQLFCRISLNFFSIQNFLIIRLKLYIVVKHTIDVICPSQYSICVLLLEMINYLADYLVNEGIRKLSHFMYNFFFQLEKIFDCFDF